MRMSHWRWLEDPAHQRSNRVVTSAPGLTSPRDGLSVTCKCNPDINFFLPKLVLVKVFSHSKRTGEIVTSTMNSKLFFFAYPELK